MMDTATAAGAVGGFVIGVSVPFIRVTTDTRGLAPGDLFVALRGERFDGHDFVQQALSSGAAAALVAQSRAPTLAGNLIAVEIRCPRSARSRRSGAIASTFRSPSSRAATARRRRRK